MPWGKYGKSEGHLALAIVKNEAWRTVNASIDDSNDNSNNDTATYGAATPTTAVKRWQVTKPQTYREAMKTP